MIKRIFALTLAFILTLSLAACGGGSNSTPSDGSSNPTGGDSSTPPSVSGEGNSAAQSDNSSDKGTRKDGLPDNKLSEQLPEFPFEITSCEYYDLESPMKVYFTDASYAEMKEYITQLEENGFTENARYVLDDEPNRAIAWTATKDGHFGIAFGTQGESDGTLTINMW